MTSVHQAREALGTKLRELRRSAGMTGRQLAERLDWPPSKVSKLETGKQTPSDSDITRWAEATGANADATTALLASLHTLESRHAEWQRLLRGGMRHHQSEWGEAEQRADLLRVFEPVYIPGLLQTAEYARARIAEAIAVHNLTNDIEDAIKARLTRQEILYDSRRRFHIVITEAALRYRLCAPADMLAQLDRLVAASTLRNLRLGVIGFGTAYARAPKHGFWMFDNEAVMVETFTAELHLAQPHEIEQYGKVFRSLADIAAYGADARTLITGVMSEIAESLRERETPETE